MDLFRKSRGDQFLFLNKRFIQNKNLNWAVVSAYQSMLPKGSYPFYALFLQVDPETIDVNVHPSKIEVRFEDGKAMYSLVHRGVKEALLRDDVIPVFQAKSDSIDQEYETIPFQPVQSNQSYPSRKENRFSSPPKEMAFQFEFKKAKRELTLIPGGKSDELEKEEMREPIVPDESIDRVSVWQLHNKYIFSQIKSGLIIIDQHLAHERILYEKALQLFSEARPVSQQQLFPKTVELSPEDFEVLLEMQYYLSRIGFVVREFGKNTVIIEAIPAELKQANEEKVIREMIDNYKESKEPDIREKIATAYSCKSAIKAGTKISTEEIVALIDNLFATKNPYFCPHGRPVIVSVPVEDLDRRFLRI